MNTTEQPATGDVTAWGVDSEDDLVLEMIGAGN